MKSLRSVKSAPSLRRAIQSSSNKANPTNLLSSPSHYALMNLNALKGECRKHGLKISGKKAELIDRLCSFDASKSGLSVANQQAAGFKSTAAKAAKGDDSSIDFYRFPKGGFEPPQPPKQMTIPMPPDYQGTAPIVEAPKYATTVPDGGAASVSGTEHLGKVHVMGDTEVRTLVDDTSSAGKEQTEGEGSSKASSKDNTFFAIFGASIAGWWALGSLSKKDKKKH